MDGLSRKNTRPLIALIIPAMFLFIPILTASAATITVPDDYSTIQGAVDAAEPNDTVYVRAGEYVENITISKPLSLIGETQTRVTIYAPNIEKDAIKVNCVKGMVKLEDFGVKKGNRGIVLNTDKGTEVVLKRVTVAKNNIGVIGYGKGGLTIIHSHLVNNEKIGLQVGTSNFLVEKNEIISNETGIQIQSNGKGKISSNFVRGNFGDVGIALYTKSCDYSNAPTSLQRKIMGKSNFMYELDTEICPSQEEGFWPNDFQAFNLIKVIEEAGMALFEGADLREEGDKNGAIRAYEKALKLFSDINFSALEEAFLHNDIGSTYKSLGQYQKALEHYREAQEIYRKRGMRLDSMDLDMAIGSVYQDLGLYWKALVRYVNVQKLYEVKERPVRLADIKSNICSLLDSLGYHQSALNYCQRAYEIYEVRTITPLQDAPAFEMELNLARLNLIIGSIHGNLNQYQEALDHFKNAQKIYEKWGGDEDLGSVFNRMGNVHSNRNSYQKALDYYKEALGLLNGSNLKEKKKYSAPALRWIVLSNIARAHQHLKDHDKAINYYKRSIKVIESLRAHYTEEKLKQAWQKRTKYVYERLIDLLTERGKGKLAFTYAERSKARTFLDLLAKGPQGTLENVVEEGIKTGTVKPEAIQEDVQSVVDTLPEDTAVLE
ncbi:tetratricopeptide repeat protein, partial [Candidatus Bipolaricaulota bacterium]|nr:tetratricopeptide repeat protein [Candidatus Bipolaricaulota bacterium]